MQSLKKIIGILLMSASACAMNVPREPRPVKQCIVTNRTGDVLRVQIAVDETESVSFFLADNQQRVVPFKEVVNHFSIQPKTGLSRTLIGFAPFNYAAQMQAAHQTNFQNNCEVTVSKMYYGSSVLPYSITINSVQGKASLAASLPISGKLIDAFPLVKEADKSNPYAPLFMTDFFAADSEASAYDLTQNYKMLRYFWETSALDADDPTHIAFAHKVVEALDSAYKIIQIEDSLFSLRSPHAPIPSNRTHIEEVTKANPFMKFRITSGDSQKGDSLRARLTELLLQ